MLFNSIEFLLFLPTVFILYWFTTNRDLKIQNGLLLIASYTFYGWWDWRFLSLIIFSSLVDYLIGLGLSKYSRQSTRKLLLLTSLIINLGFLGFFKYYNFFIESFSEAFTIFGNHFKADRLNIILPVGISFYTFQTLSYSIDIYRKKLEPTKDLISFFVFVSFFPQLVAGPIERASNLLPQFHKKRVFKYDKAVDGMRQILWGFFKKVVIADNCARIVNPIFENYADLNGSTLILGAIFFSFQIYGDFSGYSDIAIGLSRLFGFNLMKNFSFPYFSRDISEFWRRWHISLSTWFRDYLYIPLGGSKGGTFLKLRNTFIIFLVSGFWHGANWTFIIWGLLNACCFIPLMLLKKNRTNLNTVAQGKNSPSFKEVIQMTCTFGLTTLGWIFFRAENINQAFNYINRVFSASSFKLPDNISGSNYITTLILILFFMIIEWEGREKNFGIEKFTFNLKPFYRYSFYYVLVFMIIWFSGDEQQFIYFQF